MRIVKKILIIILILNALPVFARKMNILFFPFENTGNKEYSWISAGMADRAIHDLDQMGSITAVSYVNTRDAINSITFGEKNIKNNEAVIKVSGMFGSDLVFTGSYSVYKNKIHFIARLIPAGTEIKTKAIEIKGDINNIHDLQDRILIKLLNEAKKIGPVDIDPVRFGETEKNIILKKYKPGIDAYKYNVKGLEIGDSGPLKALKYFLKAVTKDGDYCDALINAGQVYDRTGNYGKALSLYSKAERLLVKQGKENSLSYALLMTITGSTCINAFKNAWDYPAALRYHFQTKKIMIRLGMQKTGMYASLMENIGIVYQKKGHRKTALKYFLKSVNIYDSLGLGKTRDYSTIMANIGYFYYDKNENTTALTYMYKAKNIMDILHIKQTDSYAAIISLIGVLHNDKGKYGAALKYLFEAKSIKDNQGLNQGHEYAVLLYNIGSVYWKKKNYDKALRYNLKTRAMLDKLGLQTTDAYSSTINNIASVYWSTGQNQKALEYLLKAKSIEEKLGLRKTDGYAYIMYNIACLYYFYLNDPCSGKKYMKVCVEIRESTGHKAVHNNKFLLKEMTGKCNY